MKRKIPARKHHGIRDPIKQNEQRLAKIKDKINNPPDRDQHVSYKLAQFIKLKNDVKSGKFKKFKKNTDGNEDKPKKSRLNTNKIKPIRKRPNETDEDYLKRVNRITTESLKESEYEMKYGVNVIRDSKTGEIKIEKRPKNEIDEILEQRKKKHKNQNVVAKGNVKEKIDPKTARELIKQVLKEEKEQKQADEIKEFKRDVIQFGETVHAPPELTLPRKAQKDETVPRPGKRNNLLLKNILNNQNVNEDEVETKISKTSTKSKVSDAVDLKGKRKELPVATRRMIEDQQTKAIELYRQLKKNKVKS